MIHENVVVVNDLETRYLSGGPERPEGTVVLLHDGAWGASAEVTWGGLLPYAATRYRVIAPDLLGFGGSAKAIRLDQSPFGFRIRHLWALLDQLGVDEPVHLVGNSFGGSVALRAMTDPRSAARIASVTTISGTGGPWRSETGAELGRFDGTLADIRRIVGLLCGEAPGLEEQVQARHRWAVAPGHYSSVMAIHQPLPEALRVARPEDPYPGSLAGTTIPLLLVAGTADVLVDQAWTRHLRELVPHAEVAELPYRHAPNITHPEETWRVLDAFLDRVATTMAVSHA